MVGYIPFSVLVMCSANYVGVDTKKIQHILLSVAPP